MPAVSKKQQRFFGMVRAAQKGEGAASPEVAKVAEEISNKDAKKCAKTKHKGLPEKKKMKEETSCTYEKLKKRIGSKKKHDKPVTVEEVQGCISMQDYDPNMKFREYEFIDIIKPEPLKKKIMEESKSVEEAISFSTWRSKSKKAKERKPQKAMDAGARAKRVLARKEYASKISGSTENVPDDIKDHFDSFTILAKDWHI